MEDHQIVILFVIGLIFGGLLSHGLTAGSYQTQAVKHNCAEYSTTTGEWRWKE